MILSISRSGYGEFVSYLHSRCFIKIGTYTSAHNNNNEPPVKQMISLSNFLSALLHSFILFTTMDASAKKADQRINAPLVTPS